jgi:isopentenyldiphosphate isomerase
MAAQDPDEPFDLYDDRGVPLGVRKARALVHRDGDWHKSVHLWVVLRSDVAAPSIVLQRRSAAKDTWPSAIDVAVTGHVRAGESLEQALREADEEIGLPIGLADVVRLGTRRRVDDARPGIVDRELQDILLAVVDRPFASLRPHPDELASVLAVRFDDALRLFISSSSPSSSEAIPARALAPGDATPHDERITARELVPATDGYYGRAIHSIERVLSGEPALPFELG